MSQSWVNRTKAGLSSLFPPSPLLVAMVATTALCVAIVWSHALPLGLPGQWVWEYRRTPAPLGRAWLPLLCYGAVVAVTGFLWERRSREESSRSATPLLQLAVVALLVFALRVSVYWASRSENDAGFYLAHLVVSPVATSYYSEAVQIHDLREYLRGFPERMEHLPFHAQTHPPGTILLFYLLRRVLGAPPLPEAASVSLLGVRQPDLVSFVPQLTQQYGLTISAEDFVVAALIGYVLPLIGAFCVVPFFFLASQLSEGRTGWSMTLLFATVPGMALFFGTVDQVYAFLALAVLSLVVAARAHQSRVFWLLSGVLLGIGVLMTLAFTAIGFMVLLLGTLMLWSHEKPGPPPVKRWSWLLWLCAGFALPLVAVYLLLDVNLLAVVRTGLAAHSRVTHGVLRSYLPWVAVNAVDFAGSLGTASACCVIAATVGFGVKRLRKQTKESTEAKLSLAEAFLMSVMATLVLLDLSGVVRGEVARIWMFLLPPCLLIGMSALSQTWQESRGLFVAATAAGACQMILTLVLNREVIFMQPW